MSKPTPVAHAHTLPPQIEDADDFLPATAAGSLTWLHRAYLHMALWGVPQYSQLDEADQRAFAEMVRNRDLVEFVQRLKKRCLKQGVRMKDSWLSEFSMHTVRFGHPVPEETRQRLLKIAYEMFAEWHRIDAEATESRDQLQSVPNGNSEPLTKRLRHDQREIFGHCFSNLADYELRLIDHLVRHIEGGVHKADLMKNLGYADDEKGRKAYDALQRRVVGKIGRKIAINTDRLTRIVTIVNKLPVAKS